MKEIIQSIIPAISALLGAGLTFYSQKKLMNKQFEINKQKIKFEKNRESLSELKAYQISIIWRLTFLKEQFNMFKEKELKPSTYDLIRKNVGLDLLYMLEKASNLHNKQLDFKVKGLTQLYKDIDVFLSRDIFKNEYVDINKIYPDIHSFDSLIERSEKLLKSILKTAKEIY